LQSSKAARAASAARLMSAAVPSGIEPMTCSVDADKTSMDPDPDGFVQAPPMYISRSWVVMGCAPVMWSSFRTGRGSGQQTECPAIIVNPDRRSDSPYRFVKTAATKCAALPLLRTLKDHVSKAQRPFRWRSTDRSACQVQARRRPDHCDRWRTS